MRKVYALGDRVQSVKGSPVMEVARVLERNTPRERYVCLWYDLENKDYRETTFAPHELVDAPSFGWGDFSAHDLGVHY